MYLNLLKTERHFDYSGHERLHVNLLACRLAPGIDEPILFAQGCSYIFKEDYHYFKPESPLIGKMINGTISHAENLNNLLTRQQPLLSTTHKR